MSERSKMWTLATRAGGLVSSALLLGASSASAEQINDPAAAWDHLWAEVVIDLTVMGLIFAFVVIYFMMKYRRRSPDEEGKAPQMRGANAIGWTLIPAFIFMADDFFLAAKGWTLWNYYRDVPEDRMEIKMEAGMYSWDYTYPNGVKTQNELIVPAGKPIMLRMTSRDVVHSHFIPDFRVKEDSMPGRVTYLWFYPKEAGAEHVVTCTEYCGIMHSYMAGRILVKTPAEFNAWYAEQAMAMKQADEEKAGKLADKQTNVVAEGV